MTRTWMVAALALAMTATQARGQVAPRMCVLSDSAYAAGAGPGTFTMSGTADGRAFAATAVAGQTVIRRSGAVRPVPAERVVPPATTSDTSAVVPIIERRPVEALADTMASAPAIDTIVVHPLEVTMRVGEVFMPSFCLTATAYDATGAEVREYVRSFFYPTSTVVQSARPGVRAITPGEATIYVEASPGRPGSPRPRPSTAVKIIVVP